MGDELISVIIPVYNTPIKLLKKCLESVYNQTYQALEIIIIDDGSEKEYREKYQKKLINKEKKCKIINIANSGVSEARNIGMENATGEYIMFLDSDDYISNDYISNLYSTLKDSKMNIVVTGATIVNCKNEKIATQLCHIENDRPLTLANYIKELINYPYFTCVKMLIKKEIITNKFNSNLKYGEDLLFAFELFKKNKIIYLNNTEYYYVQNSASACNSFNYSSIYKYLNDNLYVFNSIKKYKKDLERVIKIRLFTKFNIGLSRYIQNKECKYSNFEKMYEEFIRKYECKKIKKNEIMYLSKHNKIEVILLNKKLLKLYYLINKIKKYIK